MAYLTIKWSWEKESKRLDLSFNAGAQLLRLRLGKVCTTSAAPA
jgi:hypothetical protein